MGFYRREMILHSYLLIVYKIMISIIFLKYYIIHYGKNDKLAYQVNLFDYLNTNNSYRFRRIQGVGSSSEYLYVFKEIGRKTGSRRIPGFTLLHCQTIDR